MAFTRTWNSAYEAQPANTENISLGASRIRDLKQDIRERLAIDHSWAGDADDGKHLQVTLKEAASDPTSAANTGFVYSKDVGGVTELFYEDSSGNVVQLTSGGLLNDQAFSGFDLNGQALKLDSDGDSTIQASTNDQVDFSIGGSLALRLTSSGLTVQNALTVSGSVSLSSTLSVAGASTLSSITTSAQSTLAGFVMTGDADLDGQALLLDSDGNTKIQASTNDQIDITIGGALKYKLTANAMAVGSPSVSGWDSARTGFEIQDNLKFMGSASTNNAHIFRNAYWDGSSFQSLGSQAQMIEFNADGRIRFGVHSGSGAFSSFNIPFEVQADMQSFFWNTVNIQSGGLDVTGASTFNTVQTKFKGFNDADTVDIVQFRPNDYGSNKPLFIVKKAGTQKYQFVTWDGSTSQTGDVEFACRSLQFNGDDLMTPGLANISGATGSLGVDVNNYVTVPKGFYIGAMDSGSNVGEARVEVNTAAGWKILTTNSLVCFFSDGSNVRIYGGYTNPGFTYLRYLKLV